jgi:RimJ/RimL family protein N-acetyltransferase
MNQAPNEVRIRPVNIEDLPLFYPQQIDPDAMYMAGFAPETADYEAFLAHWDKIMGDEKTTVRTILYGDQVAGNILGFIYNDLPHVGYWIGRDYWGKGIATQALAQFLEIVTVRPIYARVLKDNLGSRRVLEKCGFQIIEEDRAISNTRKVEIEEFICRLD